MVALALGIPLLVTMFRRKVAVAELYDSELGETGDRSVYYYVGWIVGMLGLVALVGFPIGCALFIYAFVTWNAGGPHFKNAIMGVSAVAFLGVMSYFLTLRYPPGLLQLYVEMPWWIGG